MILSAAMMLNSLAEKHDTPALAKAGAAIEQALKRGFENGTVRPTDLVGNTGTDEIMDAVIAELKSATT
jgi:3-isopropylmalate dehydrogenase